MPVPHNKITFDENEIKAATAALESGYWAGGPRLQAMEEKLAAMFGASDRAVGVGSGLAALRIALLALGVGKGDEVIIPAYSCVALANAVLSIGAVPVAVDSAPGSENIDASQITPNPKTKAIIAVNTFGQPCDIKALKEIGVPVIEDCSHGYAVDEEFAPRSLQSDIAIFSFYATKLIAGGEGGAIVSADRNILEFCRDWRDYTDKAPDAGRLNDKMTDIEAALVLAQLESLEPRLQMREKAVQFYHENLSLSANAKPATDQPRIWYRYCVSMDQEIDALIEQLEQRGIAARRPVENWLGVGIKDYPNAEKAFQTMLSLPLYPAITGEELKEVCQHINEVCKP